VKQSSMVQMVLIKPRVRRNRRKTPRDVLTNRKTENKPTQGSYKPMQRRHSKRKQIKRLRIRRTQDYNSYKHRRIALMQARKLVSSERPVKRTGGLGATDSHPTSHQSKLKK